MPIDLRRSFQQEGRLTEQVEGDVRKRDVLLEDRTVAAPLGKPVTENQSVIPVTKQRVEAEGALLHV